MSFSHPWVLLLLVVPIALIALETSRRGMRVSLPLDHARVRSMRIMPLVLLCTSVLPALLAAVAILLLAGPRRLGPPGQERLVTNIEMCLDVSGSMSSSMSSAPGSTRYETAMHAINEFVEKRKGDAFGLTIFGGEVVRWVPLTRDTSAIKNATPFLDPSTLPSALNSTRVAHALEACRDTLTQQPDGDRLIVLLTDGFSEDLEGGAAARVGQDLAANHIVLHTIHVGDGAPPSQLNAVTSPTGGGVFSATNLSTLRAVFEHIDHMNKARIKPKERESIDSFSTLATIGLSLAALSGVMLFGLRYTPW